MSEFDFNKVLKIVDNDKEIAVTLLQMFIDQSKEDFNILMTAKNNDDISTIGKMAHKMKSSLATLGMSNSAEQMKKIEFAAKAGSSIADMAEDISIASSQLESIYIDIQNNL